MNNTVVMYLQRTPEGRLFGRYSDDWEPGVRKADSGKIWFPHKDCEVITDGYAVCTLVRDMDRYGFFLGHNVHVKCPTATQVLRIIEQFPNLNLGSCSAGCVANGHDSAVLFTDFHGNVVEAFSMVEIDGKMVPVQTPELATSGTCQDSTYILSSAMKQTLGITYNEYIKRYSFSTNTSDTTIDEMLNYAQVYDASPTVIRAIKNGILRLDRYHDAGELICAHFCNVWQIMAKGYVIEELDAIQEFVDTVNGDTTNRIRSSVERGKVSVQTAMTLGYQELLSSVY